MANDKRVKDRDGKEKKTEKKFIEIFREKARKYQNKNDSGSIFKDLENAPYCQSANGEISSTTLVFEKQVFTWLRENLLKSFFFSNPNKKTKPKKSKKGENQTLIKNVALALPPLLIPPFIGDLT